MSTHLRLSRTETDRLNRSQVGTHGIASRHVSDRQSMGEVAAGLDDETDDGGGAQRTRYG